MPEVNLGDTSIFYESHGKGHPLLMIRGLGSNAAHWYSQIPDLAAHYRVITFDNRGIARSPDPGGDFTVPMMAADTLGLMDALELDRPHVMGLSMGGMIAQELAINHPGRVAGLILACTHPGGRHQIRPSKQVEAIFTRMVYEDTPEAKRNAAPSLFDPRTLEERPHLALEYTQVSLKHPAGAGILTKQWEAVLGHDTFDRIHRIKASTLVLTGDADLLIPPENSGILTRCIPDARLKIVPGGGHQILVEQPMLCNRAILDFLASLGKSKSNIDE